MNSVLQDWVMTLPLRAQGTILTGIRGCDVAEKHPASLDHAHERHLIAFLRFCVLNPADPREIDSAPGAWFQSTPPPKWKPSEFGHYPLHWNSHLMHSFEVVGYCHPDLELRRAAREVYLRMVKSLHLNPETPEQMLERLTEDRLANGTVVS